MTIKFDKVKGRIFRDYIIGWTVAFIFLSVVRGVGTVEVGAVQFELGTSILIAFITGPFFGVISAYGLILTEKHIYHKNPIIKILIIRVLYSILFLVFLIFVFYLICRFLFNIQIGFLQFAFEPGSFAIYLYLLAVDFAMVVLRQVNLLLGGNNLRQLLSGKFIHPREEERIFMFLDLKSSTAIAENLGHLQYSRLIQDCFNDLGVISEFGAEIYQYVGDEVVLTWKSTEGLRNQNCLRAFYGFKQKLISNGPKYLQKYQVEPVFKAGINIGMATVAEIGKYKKQIAYHGDTLNTAARIQAKCNEFNRELLISENLKQRLDNAAFQYEKLGNISLKGKVEQVGMYAVSQLDDLKPKVPNPELASG